MKKCSHCWKVASKIIQYLLEKILNFEFVFGPHFVKWLSPAKALALIALNSHLLFSKTRFSLKASVANFTVFAAMFFRPQPKLSRGGPLVFHQLLCLVSLLASLCVQWKYQFATGNPLWRLMSKQVWLPLNCSFQLLQNAMRRSHTRCRNKSSCLLFWSALLLWQRLVHIQVCFRTRIYGRYSSVPSRPDILKILVSLVELTWEMDYFLQCTTFEKTEYC